MAELNYRLVFANVPFLTDVAQEVRMVADAVMHDPRTVQRTPEQTPPMNQQPLADLIDELNRIIPFSQLNDFTGANFYAGRNVGPLGVTSQLMKAPNADTKIGEWYYPTNASRWSIFRGLMTSSMVREVLRITKGRDPATLSMKCVPASANNKNGNEVPFTVESQMYLLPPRPLGECGFQGSNSKKFDGLYLVTLVDERYFGIFAGVKVHVTNQTTWGDLITQLATELGYTVNFSPTVLAAYGRPEADSPLWSNLENAALLLDAVAENVGSVVVRALNGKINLMQHTYSRQIAYAGRARLQPITRIAGGDIFQSGTRTAAGDLTASMNAVLPARVTVTFPKYVYGPGTPHYLNPKGAGQRPSSWFEDSYGDVYSISVPLLSGGLQFNTGAYSGQLGIYISGSLQIINGNPVVTSGLIGNAIYDGTVFDTSKATYSGEIDAQGTPLNNSGLTSLAMQLASDYFTKQIAVALDEVYPGTFAWEPEGIHDIIWTYSERSWLASTRVTRTEWNILANSMQHSTPSANPVYETDTPAGVGGHTVAQTYRDIYSGQISTTLAAPLVSGALNVQIRSNSFLPVDQRFKALIASEAILCEGTSGLTNIDIVRRGIDGTIETTHLSGVFSQITPDSTYAVNLVTHGPMQHVAMGMVTSGGITEALVVPQTQTVLTLSSGTVPIGGFNYYSGRIDHFYPNQGFQGNGYIWVVERNNNPLLMFKRYDGQFGWYSQDSPRNTPVYLVTEQTASQGPPISGTPPPTTSGLISGDIPPVLSGTYPPPTSGYYPPSNPCPPNYLTQEQMRCISGVIHIFQQRSTLGFYNGCLSLQPGNWYLARYEGCCDCPTPPAPPPCEPGDCGECNDPPNLWQIPIAGFTGLCTVFNRVWYLVQTDTCVWESSYDEGELEVTVILTIAGGIASLALSYGDGVNDIAGATFYAIVTDGDCCEILNFIPGNPADCRCSGGLLVTSPCGNCIVTPQNWSTLFSGGTNCYSSFNGPHLLSLIGDCVWHNGGVVRDGDVVVTLVVTASDIIVQFVLNTDIYANYSVVRTGAYDCCSPMTLTLTAASCPSENLGILPNQITFTPNCAGGGTCPPSLTAIPTCCDDSPVECDPIPCSACTNGTPIWWSFTLAGLTGVCSVLNGDWKVYQISACEWKFVSEDGAIFRLYFPSSSSLILTVTYVVETTTYVLSYQAAFNGDCCSNLAISLTADTCGGAAGSLTLTPNCCGAITPVSYWWCVSGTTCVEATSAPAGTTAGPFDTQVLCLAGCATASFACCQDPPIGATPTATLTNVSGCACGDTVSIGMNGDQTSGWAGSSPVFCGGGQRQLDLTLTCTANTYKLVWLFSDIDTPACGGQTGTASFLLTAPYAPVCPPSLSLYFEFSFPSDCCNGSGTSTLRVHITE